MTTTADAPDEVERERRTDSTGRVIARGFGQLFVTLGVVVLLFVVYELYVTDLFAARDQANLEQQLEQSWEDSPTVADPENPQFPVISSVGLGKPFGVMYIPRLGKDWKRVVLEGTTEAQLKQGPGHYVGTAMPGQVGNFAVAGHRVGKGSPFLDNDTIRPGDLIIIETKQYWFVYKVLGDPKTGNFASAIGVPGQEIVTPDQTRVVSPNAGRAESPKGARLITLTTCHPKYSAHQRLITHGEMVGGALPRSKYKTVDDLPKL